MDPAPTLFIQKRFPFATYPTAMAIEKLNIAGKFSTISDYWNPRIAGRLNGQLVKLVKFRGEFVWHKHELEDEFFLVVT